MTHTSKHHNDIYDTAHFENNINEQMNAFFDVDGTLFDLKESRSFAAIQTPRGSIYHYGKKKSHLLRHNTPHEKVMSWAGSQAYFPFLCSGKNDQSKFLVTIAKAGLDEGLILEHLNKQAFDAPYLLAYYHGLLGMALVDAACKASALRSPFENAASEVEFPPAGETLEATLSEQEVWLPANTRWSATLSAPVTFNRHYPAAYSDFLPEADSVVRWEAFKARYRQSAYRDALPAGVGSVVLQNRGSLKVAAIDDSSFSGTAHHPISVTFPGGVTVLMCVNSAGGFGKNRLSSDHSPLLSWAVGKMAAKGGLAAIFSHGLQRTIYSLLAAEIVNARREGRAADIPWVECSNGVTLPVVLDYEVLEPNVSAQDAFAHILQNIIG